MRARSMSPPPATSSTTPLPTSTGPVTTGRPGRRSSAPARRRFRRTTSSAWSARTRAATGVLYAGTETGLYVSLDDGASWRRWRSNFPVVPVYDLKVEGDELAIATHGRSFWIHDDLDALASDRGPGVRPASARCSTRRIGDIRWSYTESGCGRFRCSRLADGSECRRRCGRYRRWRRALPAPAGMAPAAGGDGLHHRPTDGKDYTIGLGQGGHLCREPATR